MSSRNLEEGIQQNNQSRIGYNFNNLSNEINNNNNTSTNL